MALIAIVEGVRVYVYPNDHPPAHFHALFTEDRAVFELKTLAMTQSQLPRPKARAIVAWAAPRREALMHAWILSQSELPAGRIT